MATPRKDLFGLWYLLSVSFVLVPELQLFMAFRTCGLHRYLFKWNFTWQLFYSKILNLLCHKFLVLSCCLVKSTCKLLINKCLLQTPENITYAALVLGGSFVIEGITHWIMVLYVVSPFSFNFSPLKIKNIFFRCFTGCCHTSCQERCSCWGNEIERLRLARSWSYICCSNDRGYLLCFCHRQ